ncbi:hypothetical protein K488DRAFT_84671 [Vararia minispora EC-137]|uniref:Uncharacterized protein n=1 Tax=Vararia minispora EC-137 TaxID=1314806 RepID=A0ACB8QQ89_9AGAM|nr:hypothetical protein K488DRAFT_84671 [Vararia minispora EC-137]
MFFATVSVALAISLQGTFAYPFPLRPRVSGFQHQNGLDAQAQNQNFTSLTPDSPCTAGEDACVNNKFAQCVSGKFVLQSCGSGEICASLPLVNSAGTSITCTTAADRDSRIQAALGTSGNGADPSSASTMTTTRKSTSTKAMATATSSASASTSTALDPSVVAKGFAQNGLNANGSEAGEVASQTSTNNFINFCLTTKLPITDGQQIKSGSCNPAPMGMIASVNNMPASKFVKPANLDTIKANTSFDIVMAIKNLATGNFVNAQSNYYSAPQRTNGQGNIIGHTHFVIEELQSLKQTEPLNNSQFAFFQGVNGKADSQGQLKVTVNQGLPKGFYRLASINAAENHQPVLVAVAQHGSLDDMVYFTVQ